MENGNTKTKKLEDMTDVERKAYNEKMSEKRKTPEFFKETATYRVNKVLNGMRTLGFMGNYNGTDDQKDAIVEAVENGLDELRAAIYKKNKDKNEFTL